MNDLTNSIRQGFGFTPSDDFFQFWEFAQQTNAKAPLYAFNELTDISLAGPFAVCAGQFATKKAKFDPCLHWRYFGDPPEFITILTGGSDGLHWGYVIDQPDAPPCGTVGYYAYDDVTFFTAPASLFDLLAEAITNQCTSIRQDMALDPEMAKDPAVKKHLDRLQKLHDSITAIHDVKQREKPSRPCIEFLEHCDGGLPFPIPDNLDKLPQLIEKAMKQHVGEGKSAVDMQLALGRLLWHWHSDGHPVVEQQAFELLDAAYAARKMKFLRHVLSQHRQHRHRPSLDVFA